MSQYFMLLPIFVPVLFGAILPLFRFESAKRRRAYVSSVTILNTILMFVVMFLIRPEGDFMLLNMAGKLSISFHMDGLGCVFGSLIAVLWPIATFYAFEYMKHEEEEKRYFGFYVMVFGVLHGLVFSGNMVTYYLFYELMTLLSVPLILHNRSKEAIKGGLKYLFYSLFGAYMVLFGIFFLNRFVFRQRIAV